VRQRGNESRHEHELECREQCRRDGAESEYGDAGEQKLLARESRGERGDRRCADHDPEGVRGHKPARLCVGSFV
jgi:hypothetical protein